MERKLGFLGIIFVFVFALVGFYIYLKKQQTPASSTFNAVPINAALIIDVENPTKFIKQVSLKNNLWNELVNLKELSSFQNNLLNLDSIFSNQLINKDLLHQKDIIVSFHELGNKKYKPIFYIKYNGRFEGNQAIKAIEQLCLSKGKISSSRYNQVKVFSFKSNANKKFSFFYGFHKGILMLSPSEILIQDAIRQTESDQGLLQEQEFTALRETAGDYVDANIYVQFDEFQKMLGHIIDLDLLKKTGVNKYAEWGVFDLNVKNNTFLFNGYSSSQNNKSRITKVFAGQKPQNLKFIKHISNMPEAFTLFGLSNTKLLRQNLADYMEDIGQKDRFDVNEQSIRNAFGNQAVNELEELVKNELALVTLPDGSTIFAMQTSGYRNSAELLQRWFKHYSKTTNSSISAFQKQYKIDNDTEFLIYEMPLKKFPTRMFGPWFNKCKANYVGLFDDYIILTDTYKSLTNFIYNNVLQKTIAYNGAYKEFENYLSSKTNYYQFVSLTGTGKYIERWLTPSSYNYSIANQEQLKNFYAVAFQFSVDNNLIYNSLLFRNQPGNSIQASTEWESKLDTSVNFKPALLRNHYTGNKEVFIQDQQNAIYLLNKSGRILWKQKLNEPILGEVHQVDFYKNGKLQILFNTKSKIHIIDRNGNYVERFPINLPEQASAPLALFDYDKRKNYRIFIPTISNKVYCYNIKGQKVSGFKFSGTDYSISKPVQYFRNNNKDYLVVTDEKRTYILDRKGNERMKIKQQFEPSLKNKYSLQPAGGNRKARIVTTDNTGTVHFIYFDGSVQTKSIESFTENHFFNVEDINHDGVDEYIYVDDKELIAFSNQGKEIFTYKFSTDIVHSPSFYKFSSKNIGIGIAESEKSKIHIINEKGELLEGFPLQGKTRFSIGLLTQGTGRFNLFVGGDDFYLYNYKLN